MASLKLGHVDAGVAVPTADWLARFHDWKGRAGKLRGVADSEWLGWTRAPQGTVSVRELQQKLQSIRLYKTPPDGIFGYRTLSGVRLFQELVRTLVDPAIGAPDGKVGPTTLRYLDQVVAGPTPIWMPKTARPGHAETMSALRGLRSALLHDPDAHAKVLKANAGGCTRGVANWTFDADDIHLVGMRRHSPSEWRSKGKRANDDIFVLCVGGLRLGFRGSTDPSPNMSTRSSLPYLIRAQHAYRFGWHKIKTVNSSPSRPYRAFKPDPKVLVVRDRIGDMTDSLADIQERGNLELNGTINIHWSGAGTSNWSAGCQVIAGKRYMTLNGDRVKCDAFASPGYSGLKSGKTRGAYDVLLDFVTVFSDDLRTDGSKLLYTLVYERDLDRVPDNVPKIDFNKLVERLS